MLKAISLERVLVGQPSMSTSKESAPILKLKFKSDINGGMISHSQSVQFRFQNPIFLQRKPFDMSWTCKKCTFINSPSSKSTCGVCLTPSSPVRASSSSSPSNAPKWSCKACTFLNLYSNASCEICGTRAPASSLSCFDDLTDIGHDDDLDSSVGSVFQPLKSCKRKIGDFFDGGDKSGAKLGGFQGFREPNKAVTVLKDMSDISVDANAEVALTSFKIMSYNVWFREDLELHRRMKAIGDLILLHSPEVICFQEVTPNIYEIFRQSPWWKTYRCSVSNELDLSRPYFCMLLSKLPVKLFKTVPFDNSIMGRELCIAELEVQPNKPLVVATSHLESPCPAPPTWDQMFSKERVAQAKKATDFLKKNRNVIFGGDMNWDDKLDGNFPLPEGWIDAWGELKPGDSGWTYDTKSNLMLSGNRKLQKRLDRFFCNLKDFRVNQIDMIGKEAISGLLYGKEKKVRNEVKLLELPVLPSDHYGLLLTVFVV